MNFNIYRLFLNNSLQSQTFEDPYSQFSVFNSLLANPVLKIIANEPQIQTMEDSFLPSSTNWSQNQASENLPIKEPLKIRPQTMENPFLYSFPMCSKNQASENLPIREPLKTRPQISTKNRQKAPYNFGKTAIGTYMMKRIHKGFYDDFMIKTLNRDQAFIKCFKQFCFKLDYKTCRDFRHVWKHTDFIDSEKDPSHNFYVALKKITELFLKKDVTIWIEKKTKLQEYRPLYMECAEMYRKGIENIENFDFSKFC